MKIIKVTGSAGNRPATIMEEEKEEEGKTKGKTASLLEEEEDGKTKGKTASLLEEEEESKTKGKTASLLEEEPADPDHHRLQEGAGEVKWAWKRESVQGHGNKLKMRLSYKKSVFQNIKWVLTQVGGEQLKKQFVNGCFGHLMNFIGGTNCIVALYELIAREIDAPKAEDGLWFRIGGTNIRFSPKEFALVTGLHFGSSTFDPLGSHEMPKDGVCKRCFRGRSTTIIELLKKFNSQRVPGSAEDYLKVANILILYLMVLGYYRTKRVDTWVWVLVEDLPLWNRFPWGAYSYQALLHYVSKVPRTREDLDKIKFFLGPMWALQIWAYEAIPELGKTCALVNGKDTMPRCLKWEYLSKKIALAPKFFEELQCFVNLDPTDEEKQQTYWESVETPEPLGVIYAPPLGRGRRAAGSKVPLDESVLSQEQLNSDSLMSPSPRRKRTRAPTRSHGVPQRSFDEARFVDRISERVVECLSQRLIPQMKQLIESRQSPLQPQPSREVHDEVHDTSVLHEKPCGNHAKSAKAAKRKKDKRSCNGGSSSMNISKKADNGHFTGEKMKPVQKDAFGGEEQLEGLGNASRLDTGVSGGVKSSENRKDAIHDQIGSSKRLKGELKRKAHMSPHREGGEANIAKKKKDKKKKKSSMSKQTRRSPSLSEDEGSESSSGNERRRKLKKRSKKKERKHSESSSSEGGRDRDRNRRKRNRHKRRHSSSSEASDSGSR